MTTRAERRRTLRKVQKSFAGKGTKKDRREFRKHLHEIAAKTEEDARFAAMLARGNST